MSIDVMNISRPNGNKLDADFLCKFDDSFMSLKSRELIICGLLSVQVEVKCFHKQTLRGLAYVDVCVQELQKSSYLRFECKVGDRGKAPSLVLIVNSGKTYGEYQEIYSRKVTIKLSFQIGLLPSPNPKFSSLYDDGDLTDFKLCGTDGAITVHRLILAAHSPVLKTMLTGTWKETNEGRVDISGTSAQTLENLKKYLYLDQLPDDNGDLEPLLVLSTVYMMKDLAQECSAKLLFNITAENVVHYIQLACQYKLKLLMSGILKCNYFHNADLQFLYDDNEWL